MFCLYSVFFFFYCCRDHGDLPSFPTRRSSDLGASGCATRAVRPAPTAVPRSSSASSRGVSDPASRSRSAPALRSAPVVWSASAPIGPVSSARVALTEPIGLVGHDQGVDEVVEIAVQNTGQVVDGLPDAV